MLTITLYMRAGCSLCEQAVEDLERLQSDFPHRLVQIDVEKEGLSEYLEQIPVLETGPYKIKAPFDKKKLKMTLGAAQDRQIQLKEMDLASHKNAPYIAISRWHRATLYPTTSFPLNLKAASTSYGSSPVASS